jgi:hypothetical protein
MAVPADEFETMLARMRGFRRRVDELGSVGGPIIDADVRAHRNLSPADYLPSPQRELAETIVALLEDPRLSALQAAQLERAFFGR